MANGITNLTGLFEGIRGPKTDEERKRQQLRTIREQFAGTPLAIVTEGLITELERDAPIVNEDPLTLAERDLAQVSPGRRLLQHFLTGLAQGLGGPRVQTIRENLVQKRVLQQRIQQRQQELQDARRLRILNTLGQFSAQVGQQRRFEEAQAGIQERFDVARKDRKQIRDAQLKSTELNNELTQLRIDKARTPEGEKVSDVLDRMPVTEEDFLKRDKALKLQMEQFEEEQRIRAKFRRPKGQAAPDIPTNTPLGQLAQNAFLNLGDKLPENQRGFFKAALSDAVGRNDFQGIRDLLRTKAMTDKRIASASAQEEARKREDIFNFLDRIEDQYQQLFDAGIETGPVFELQKDVLRRAGRSTGTVSDPELVAKIEQDLLTNMIAFRKIATGVAFREQEQAQIDRIFMQLGDTPPVIMGLLQNMRKINQQAQNEFYTQVLGERAADFFFRPKSVDEINLDF